MESEDTQQSPATGTSRVVTISVWLVTILVGYVASSGPAIWLMTRFELLVPLLRTIYYPVMWLGTLDPSSQPAQLFWWWYFWWNSLAIDANSLPTTR